MKAPNILFVFTDQQRADTVAALGAPIIRTPTLDRLAREGASFLRAYTPSPVCCAARCALMTGLPPRVTGCVDNMPMPADIPSYVERLASAGYRCHGIGKMHFTPDHRRMWGFHSRDFSEEGHADDYADFLRRQGHGHVLDLHGLRGEHYYVPQPSQVPAALTETHWVADRAIEFLRRHDRTQPFFLAAHFIKPHPPFEVPAPWYRLYRADEMPSPYQPNGYEQALARINLAQNRYKYVDRAAHDDLRWRTIRAAYYAAISWVDYNVGRIIAALGDTINDTLVVFSSDHGEMLGDYGSAGKRCMLEASARIPLIVRLPGRIAAGSRVRAPATLLDIYPTLLDAAGLGCEGPHAEGESLIALAAAGPRRRRIVCSQFQRGAMGNYLATDGVEKYVWSAADQREWHYRIGDAVREMPARVTERGRTLKTELLARHRAAGDEAAVTRTGWRRHRVRPFPSDPDYGLLRQDPPALQPAIDALPLGYRRKVTRSDAQNYRIIRDHCD